MRVLFWSSPFWPSIGGVEVLAAKLLSALRERGYEFLIVTGRDFSGLSEVEYFRKIPVYRFPFWTALTDNNLDQVLAIRQQVTRLTRSFAPNLVHVNAFGPSVLFHLDTAKAYPAPLLVTLHGGRYKELIERDSLFKKTLSLATWVTGCSAAVVEDARQLMPEIIPRSSIIYNGLEAPPVLPEPIPSNPPRVLCLGRLSYEKGFDFALTAFATAVTQFPRARLMVAGDGPERTALERQALQLGIRHAVDFLGAVTPDTALA